MCIRMSVCHQTQRSYLPPAGRQAGRSQTLRSALQKPTGEENRRGNPFVFLVIFVVNQAGNRGSFPAQPTASSFIIHHS